MVLIINILGFFGGFVLLVIKCDCGFKDWGVMIEGYGGMLDWVDLISFLVLIFFYILCYWWVY